VRRESGFSLLELTVAMTLMLIVTASVFSMMNPANGAYAVEPEVTDMQQRLRVGVDTLTKDLMMAGAGAYYGSQSGSLVGFFAPVLPSRQGNVAQYDDGPGAYFDDRITLFYVPSTSAQTSISQAMPNVSSELKVNPEPGCPSGQNLCGFQPGMSLLIYDDTGFFDTLTITSVQDQAGHLQHNQQGDLSNAYGPGAKVAQVADHVYFRDAATNQLMHYDGFQTITPVLDNVVGLKFEYYG
jgi:prepilin-type N-terminal cleavage/methylation domain-containing protein